MAEQSDGAMCDVAIPVNGRDVVARVEARTLLVDFLREQAGCNSVRMACEEGACGACTVELNGLTVKSCLVLAAGANGSPVITVDGISAAGELSPLQEAFNTCHALQCGYCTAGMLMSARAFINARSFRDFNEHDIRYALAGNICRCTGYNNIIEAVKVAAGRTVLPQQHDNRPAGAANWIGQSIPRREDRRLLSGRGRYCDNVGQSSDLHAVAARSTRAHARIRHIDTSRAAAMPGVERVITGAQAQAHWQPLSPTLDLLDVKLPRRYALATDKVVFYGEPIALIIAASAGQAEDAARAVEVEYIDLPAVVDTAQSIAADGDRLLYPEWGDNQQLEYRFEHGAVDDVFARADLVVDEHIDIHRASAMPLETRVVRADFDAGDKRLVVHSSTQVPHQTRLYLARVFGIPENRIQVIAGDVGGGFGAKLSVDCEYLPVLATILTGRPVKWFEPRSAWLHAGFAARDYHCRSRAAFTREGDLQALETDIVCDVGCDGAERGGGVGMPINGGNYAPGPYRCAVYRTRVRCMVTNKGPYNALRGYGKDLANVLVERVFDQAAERLEIDTLALRRRNLLHSYPHQLVTGPILENGSTRESLERLELLMNLPELRRRQTQALAQGRYLGLSLIPYLEPAGVAFPGSAFQNYEAATVRIAADGSVQLLTGIQSIGQGIETSYAQVVADILGCRLDDVSVVWGDTAATPWGSGTFSSRGAMYAVGAMLEAGGKLRQRLQIGAAALLGGEPEQIDIVNSVLTARESGATCTLAELAYAAYVNPGAEVILDRADAPLLEAHGIYRNAQVNWKADEFGRAQFYPAHANGAEGMLLEVDPNSGRIDILQVWLVADHGVVLNPLLLKGQITGGVVQQIGTTLYEQLDYDSAGIPRQRTLKEYGMPTIWAAPPIHIEHLQSHSPSTKIGAKGGGEDGCIATTTALMAAVEDALRPFGVKVMSSPLSPARIRALILAAQR